MDPTEETLVERARAGDGEALRALFERHGETMRRFAERRLPPYLRRRASVADVLQEARLVAFRRHADFEPRGTDSYRNWLLGILDRKIREAVRAHVGSAKRSVRREVTRGARPETRELRGRTPTPSAVARGAEAAELAEEALRQLAPDHRAVLELTRREHLDLTQAAERLGRSREATRKLLARAVAAFGKAFEELGGRTRDG